MDDINLLEDDDNDLLIIDQVCLSSEAASGAILNRNCKSVLLGLGSWTGHQDWPPSWLQVVPSVKTYGVMVTPVRSDTVKVT